MAELGIITVIAFTFIGVATTIILALMGLSALID